MSPRSPARTSSSVSTWLTREVLVEMLGPARLSTAELYLSSYPSVAWAATAHRIQGQFRVAGRPPLQTVVSSDDLGLVFECQCEDYLAEGSCVHAGVLALLWLQRHARAAPSSERPSDAESLTAWLEARHLSRAASLRLSVVAPHLPPSFSRHLTHFFGEDKVVTPLLGKLSSRYFVEHNLPPITQAAWDWLDAEAERVRLGLEREATGAPRAPPTDARLLPLVQALQLARERVRAQAMPRVHGPRLSVVLQDRPVRLCISEPELVAWSSGLPSHGVDLPGFVEVNPVGLLDGRAGLACPCSPGVAEPACVHALSAMDAVLDQLSDPKAAESNARLAELLFVVAGDELWTALERTAVAVTAHAPGTRALDVSFRVEGGADRVPLRIRVYVHRPLKKGGMSAGALLGLREVDEARAVLTGPGEAEALALIQAAASMSARFHDAAHPVHGFYLQALRLLARNPRLRWAEEPEAPLRVREAPLGFAVEDAEGTLRLRPAIEGTVVGIDALQAAPEDSTWPQPWLLMEPELPRLTLVSVPPEARPLLDTLRTQGARLPSTAREALLERLSGLEARFALSLPASLEAREVEGSAALIVRLRPSGEAGLSGGLYVQPLPEASPQPPGAGPEVVRGLRARQRVMVRRAFEPERERADDLLGRLGLTAGEYVFHRDDTEAALTLLESLEPLADAGSVRVDWEEQAWSVVRSPDASKLRVEVVRQNDWFGVKGGVQLEGERVELALLLDALRRRQRYVPLGPGRWLRLTEALRERLLPLSDHAQPTRQGVEVSAAAAPVLDALAEAGASVKAPAEWRTLAARIREARDLKVSVPRGLKAELRDYQREGFVWLARHAEWGAGACLADDMGLGKTLQTLALLLHRASEGPALVVAPTSVCGNWVREAARFAPSLRLHVWHEADRDTLPAQLGRKDVLVMSYGLLARDGERLSSRTFATLVVDEAQAIKNPDTVRARAVRAVKAQARVALSGTPVENRLAELWSLFHFLFPGLLGGRESFRERFAQPIERDRDAEVRASLARVVRPFLLRRTKAQVARELPPRVESVVPVTLSDAERRLYEDTRLAALARMGVETPGQDKRFELLAALTRLRLAACHPRLVDGESGLSSAKLERVLEHVEALRAEGGRALVFSQFVRHLSLVREALLSRGLSVLYLDGQTPPAERQARVDAFQRGEGELFLISLKAGGTGLNLTGADHVLHLDPWWNPAVEDQATDRAHRIGQTRPVTVCRFVSEGTIEEAILALHAEKRDLADSLLSEADGGAALSSEQLLALLRFSGDTARG
ncbi:DEAD/DEAH box helicase [Corallococcus sp. M34]|uniref:DEAD/DEAH box helicase n=1 Tax=Citreicoccus inhibens TaxID=2849499 RepID=UPI001C241AE6|nr:DEAD/DEAH box helicase [Citreicoccus inhibens]MBU8898845.1 DEAD/DEAH box helicase [Citreicoccus inhibens]